MRSRTGPPKLSPRGDYAPPGVTNLSGCQALAAAAASAFTDYWTAIPTALGQNSGRHSHAYSCIT
jgi:hypothetical protein